MNDHWRWLTTSIYAAAMAWVESSVVLYMRTLLSSRETMPVPQVTPVLDLGQVELIREAATLIMLLSVGWLAGKDWRSRLGHSLLAFGVWDILYYAFLIPMTGWPETLLDWDLLFLIPLPWWGPVLAPASVAGLMIAFGLLILLAYPANGNWPEKRSWTLNLLGIGLVLFTFMEHSIQTLINKGRAEVFRPPDHFNWPLFCLALVLMAAPFLDLLGHSWKPLRAHSIYSDSRSTGKTS